MTRFSWFVPVLLMAGAANAYSINYSYSGANDTTEYFGACEDGEQLKIIALGGERFAFEGPAGEGEVTGRNGLDKAAAAACGE